MEQTATSTTETRYLGVDLHKHYLVIGGVNARQEVVLVPRRVELDNWPAWAVSISERRTCWGWKPRVTPGCSTTRPSNW